MGTHDAKRGFRLFALLLGLLAGLGAAEVGLRLAGEPRSESDALAEMAAGQEPPARSGDCAEAAAQARLREVVAPSRHPDLVYELRAGVNTCFEGAGLKTNSRGVRAAGEFRYPKRTGTHRVLILGDSHAFGWGIEEADTVAAQLEAALASLRESSVEVVNAGVPGYSAYQEAAWLEAYGADLEPDCVVVLFVANDMGLPHFLLQPRKPGPSRLWERLGRWVGSKRWFTFAPNELATFVSEVQMERIPPEYRHMVGEAGYREALGKMAEWARGRGIDLVNVFDYSTLKVDAKALIEYQEALGVTALDTPWPADPSLRISRADPHLNQKGNARVAQSLVKGLEARSVCLPPEAP